MGKQIIKINDRVVYTNFAPKHLSGTDAGVAIGFAFDGNHPQVIVLLDERNSEGSYAANISEKWLRVKPKNEQPRPVALFDIVLKSGIEQTDALVDLRWILMTFLCSIRNQDSKRQALEAANLVEALIEPFKNVTGTDKTVMDTLRQKIADVRGTTDW